MAIRRFLRALLPLLVLVVLVVGGLQLRAFLERPPTVDVAPTVRQDVARVLALTGRVRPQLRNRLTPVVRARLIEVTRQEGEAIAKGDILARLDARPIKASIAQTRAEIELQRQERAQRLRDVERAEKLAAEQLLPPSELENERLQVELVERRIATLAEQVKELEARLDDYVLRSPIDGWILERPVDPGQTVGPGEVIYELATKSAAQVEVEVDERYLGELYLGQSATAALISGRRTQWQTTIAYIGRRIDRRSGAVVIRLDFVDEAPDLPAGLSLDVNLLIEEHRAALTVPRSAVSGLGSDTTWVRFIDGDRAVRREVEVVDWPAPRLVVLSGLEEGERVALDPKRVSEGIALRPRQVEAAD